MEDPTDVTLKTLILDNLQFVFLILIVIIEIIKDTIGNIKNGKSLKNTIDYLIGGIIICGFSFYIVILVSMGVMSWGYILKNGLAYMPQPVLIAVQFASIFFGYKVTQRFFQEAGYKHNGKPKSTMFHPFVKAFAILGSFPFYLIAIILLAIVGRVFGLSSS